MIVKLALGAAALTSAGSALVALKGDALSRAMPHPDAIFETVSPQETKCEKALDVYAEKRKQYFGVVNAFFAFLFVLVLVLPPRWKLPVFAAGTTLGIAGFTYVWKLPPPDCVWSRSSSTPLPVIFETGPPLSPSLESDAPLVITDPPTTTM